MIIRAFVGLVVAPVAAVAALYGLSMVMEPSPGVYGAPESEPVTTGEERVSEPHEEPMGEPPIALPYDEGGAAAFLADVFEGTEAYWLWGVDSRADLASFSAQVAQPGSGGDASCAPSHVMLHCSLQRADGYGYTFGLQQSADGGWSVVNDEVRLLDNS
ncbi:MAG: hypothetical protein CMH90_03640 [Oceanicaulis sp.]|uniref:hypothetical protein n=1 Tax=Oceanicaulis sp. UBA2681 TaxID=1947007 RepID=UPI000C0A5EBF|nr:hypothetical protein [Oceanicaulis sp. UBA2681]MAP48554.1 hypothetical protein [Oceanicaulis sp.]HCR65884.1 hypothetical protein [Oceanicaulis sp.]|tara:strand:- start:2462 stop:2938 length:477 start_codon:yes stop_codon:yes gene_type:complete